jgi:hypothetical protein
MKNSSKLKMLADKMDECVEEMNNQFTTFKKYIREAEEAGSEVGLSISSKFNVYEGARMHILLNQDHSFLTNDCGLIDTIDSVSEASVELEAIEDDDSGCE